METLLTVTLVHMECGYKGCGCVFGISQEKYNRCKADGEDWYCPNGHCRVFCESTKSKMQKKLNQEKRKTEYLRADVEKQRELKNNARHQARTYKGNVTKIKNRVAKGVCPCCSRHFKDLERHMQGQHPDFKEKE